MEISQSALSDNKDYSHILIMILLALITWALLFFFRSSEQIGDALLYATEAKKGGLDFIPKKLLLGSILSIFYSTLAAITNCDAIFAAQIHDFIWATIAILATYVTLENLVDSRICAAMAALLTLVTNCFWVWSNQADAYLPVLGCFALLAMLLVRYENTLCNWKNTLLLSAIVAVSALYHQTSVLFCVPLGTYLLFKYGRNGVRQFIFVTVISGSVVLSVYIASYCYLHSDRTLTDFIDWTLSGGSGLKMWGTFDNYSIKGTRDFIDSQVRNIVIIPQSLKVLRKFAKLIIAIALTSVFAWNVYRVIKKAPRQQVRMFYLTWWLVYSLFSLWWLPTYRQLIVSNILPIVALGSLTICDLTVHSQFLIKRTYGIIGITLLIALIFTSNLFASVLPMHLSRGEDYAEARRLFALAGEKCLIMSGWRDGLSLEYYFNRKPLYIRQQLLEFYYGSQAEENPLAFGASNNLCSVGALKYILPSHSIDRIDGYKRPTEWLAFAEWLFQVKYNPQSKQLTYSMMDTVVDDENDVYFIIDYSSRRTVSGLGAMFEELDQAISRKRGLSSNSFNDWFVKFQSFE